MHTFLDENNFSSLRSVQCIRGGFFPLSLSQSVPLFGVEQKKQNSSSRSRRDFFELPRLRFYN